MKVCSKSGFLSQNLSRNNSSQKTYQYFGNVLKKLIKILLNYLVHPGFFSISLEMNQLKNKKYKTCVN